MSKPIASRLALRPAAIGRLCDLTYCSHAGILSAVRAAHLVRVAGRRHRLPRLVIVLLLHVDAQRCCDCALRMN